jgi:hypothetical protein
MNYYLIMLKRLKRISALLVFAVCFLAGCSPPPVFLNDPNMLDVMFKRPVVKKEIVINVRGPGLEGFLKRSLLCCSDPIYSETTDMLEKIAFDHKLRILEPPDRDNFFVFRQMYYGSKYWSVVDVRTEKTLRMRVELTGNDGLITVTLTTFYAPENAELEALQKEIEGTMKTRFGDEAILTSILYHLPEVI